MPLEFTERGFITPTEKVVVSLEEFQKMFVEPFPTSITRKNLYRAYINYSNLFKTEITENFVHWIGGSFTSMKLNPNDMDVVIIVPHEIFETYAHVIEEKFRKNSLLDYGIDAYIVVEYPMEHKKHNLYQSNILYWNNQFSKTRKNRAGKRFNRGFIEIIHQKQQQ